MKKVLLLCLIILTANIVPLKAQNDFEIAKNVDIFVSILKELNAKYADEVVPGDLVKTAIDAMLKDLVNIPFTNLSFLNCSGASSIILFTLSLSIE